MFDMVLKEHFKEPTDYKRCFHLFAVLLNKYVVTYGQQERFDIDIPENDIDSCYIAELIFDRFEWSDKL